LFLGCGHVLGGLDDGANNSLLFLFLILATTGGAKISAALIVVFVYFFPFLFLFCFPQMMRRSWESLNRHFRGFAIISSLLQKRRCKDGADSFFVRKIVKKNVKERKERKKEDWLETKRLWM